MPIEFKNVFHIYSKNSPFEQIGLDDINLKLDGEHHFVALVGHTGSGKSTLAQHINGLLIPTSGEIEIEQFKITSKKKKNRNVKELRKHAGLVFQFPEYQLFEDTVLKDIAFGPKNFGDDIETAKTKAKAALNSVGIGEEYYDRSPFELSGGEKRRVAIAGIIAIKPALLILDEPTAGLDPKGVKQLMQLFKLIQASGTNIIFITHNMDQVLEYCDYGIVMQDGKIVRTATPIELFSDDLIANLSLEMPMVYDVAKKLIAKGMNLDLSKIHNVDSLALEIAKARGKI